MAWRISGTYYAPCSCKVSCPCELGELEADQGWCSGVLLLDVRNGEIEGVNVSNSKVVFVADWPGGMLGGNGTAVLYFDPAVSQQQRSALEGVLAGKKGGVFEVLSTLVPNIHPSKTAPINILQGPDQTRITVGSVGELVIAPLKGATGEPTRLLHGAAAFRDDVFLAKGTGSRWRDPDMRPWESGGHAEYTEFDWSA